MKDKCLICKQEKKCDLLIGFKINYKCILICKDCYNEISNNNQIDYEKYLELKKEEKKQYNKNYKKNNIEKQKEYAKKYREENKEKLKKEREQKKEYYKNYNKKYHEENKEYFIKKQKERYDKLKKEKEILKQDNQELKNIKKRVRCLINKSFTRRGYKKGTKTEKILGCDYETFYKHLLKTYKLNYGRDWDFTENVDIDHIKPLKLAKTKEDVTKLCHYTNLQLLKSKDNKKKSAKF